MTDYYLEPEIISIKLELECPPIYDFLNIFVEYPMNSKKYLFRKVHVRENSFDGDKRNYMTVDLIEINRMQDYNVSECDLRYALHTVTKAEIEAGKIHKDYKRAAIGVVKFRGSSTTELDSVVIIAGLQYHNMKKSVFN